MTGTCGRTPSESFAWLDPDTSSWRTYQVSFLEMTKDGSPMCTQYSGTLPKRGSMRNGKLSELTMQELPTEEKGGSALPIGNWPTPDAFNDPKAGGSAPWQKSYKQGKQIHLHHAVRMNWPTPQASEHKSNLQIRENNQNNLSAIAGNWPTPNTSDRLGANHKDNHDKSYLRGVATKWPTPTTQETVHTDIEMTHTGRRKTKDGKNSHSLNLEDTTRINSQTTHQDHQTHPDGSTCSVSCRRLNPLFVEYLMMGKWLIGWTDLKPLGTQSLGRQELSLSGSVSKGQES